MYVGKLQKSKLFGFSIKEKAVAIKVLSGYNVDDSRVVATISEELRNMARVMRQSEMPHLVTFYGCCFQDKGLISNFTFWVSVEEYFLFSKFNVMLVRCNDSTSGSCKHCNGIL